MDTPNLIAVCSLTFVVVFLLLTFLAIAMRLITALFPDRRKGPDPTLAAAISSSVAMLYSGARVTKIEEESS